MVSSISVFYVFTEIAFIGEDCDGTIKTNLQ